MDIRRAEARDHETIAQLTASLGYPTTADAMRRRLERMEGDPDRVTLVVVVDGLVVGYVGVSVAQGYEADEPHSRVMALVVEPGHRRRGIGRRLLRTAEEWARARGARTMVLNSGEQRVDAHAFYERHGYAHTGRRYRKDLDAAEP